MAAQRATRPADRVAAPGRPAAQPARRGMTLIELLVVTAIMAILLGVAIPVLSPADDSRRLREAARGVNTFLSGAKTRAKETGRPFGVALKRLSQDTGRAEDRGVCLEMYYVEQPPPYAGFSKSARVMLGTDAIAGGAYNPSQVLVRFVNTGMNEGPSADGLPFGLDTDPIPFGVIQPGDVIEIGDRRFRFIDTANNGAELDGGYYAPGYGNPPNSFFVTPLDGAGGDLRYVFDSRGVRLTDAPISTWVQRYWTAAVPYKILRRPIKTSNEPFQLPNNAAIDLEASGFGSGVRLHNWWNGSDVTRNDDDVIVMFSPEGAISEAYLNTGDADNGLSRSLISSNLFLLVGLRENQPADDPFASFSGTDNQKEDAKEKINWLNGDTRWVVIGAQTGTVATAENAFVDPERATASVTDTGAQLHTLSKRRDYEVTAAREFARQSVGMGGR